MSEDTMAAACWTEKTSSRWAVWGLEDSFRPSLLLRVLVRISNKVAKFGRCGALKTLFGVCSKLVHAKMTPTNGPRASVSPLWRVLNASAKSVGRLTNAASEELRACVSSDLGNAGSRPELGLSRVSLHGEKIFFWKKILTSSPRTLPAPPRAGA